MITSEIAARWRPEWLLDDDVRYLNHGSFGPSPRPVIEAAEHWTRELERQPMNFYLRRMEVALEEATESLARFLGTGREGLILTDNATSAMNVVASSLNLGPDDEVLINDHEYGAVARIWRRSVQPSGARVVNVELPDPLTDDDAVIESLFRGVTPRTRLIVVSHVTSPTAVILPVNEICRRARKLNIPVCIDGPHAIAMLPVDLKRLDCDFYAASCHKWLCGPFGSGFLYVHPHQRKRLQPTVVSWGGSIGGYQPSWKDEFNWIGTRNPASFLGVTAAINFLQQPARVLPSASTALEEYRQHARLLLDFAEQRMTAVTNLPPFADRSHWCGSMAAFHLPRVAEPPKFGERDPLQNALWDRFHIEIPIVHWRGQRFVRVSSHLYNSPAEIEVLADALRTLL